MKSANVRSGNRSTSRRPAVAVAAVEPVYHIGDIAARCGVPVDTVWAWVDMGLRHLPLLGPRHSGVYKPRDAIVREAWLLAFLDAQAVVRPKRTADAKAAARPTTQTSYPKPAKGRRENPLGPCPV